MDFIEALSIVIGVLMAFAGLVFLVFTLTQLSHAAVFLIVVVLVVIGMWVFLTQTR